MNHLPPNERRLALAAAALAAVQLAHLLDVLRYSEHATFPRVLFDPLGLSGVAASLTALGLVLLRLALAPRVVAVVGAAVAVGFVLYHGVPFDLAVNNPYWGKADAIQWLTVLTAIAVGVVCAAWGFREMRMRQHRQLFS